MTRWRSSGDWAKTTQARPLMTTRSGLKPSLIISPAMTTMSSSVSEPFWAPVGPTPLVLSTPESRLSKTVVPWASRWAKMRFSLVRPIARPQARSIMP